MPFGEEVPPQTPQVDQRLFLGKERDAETGLDLFDARYLRGETGRFTSPDPVAFAAAGGTTRASFWKYPAHPERLTWDHQLRRVPAPVHATVEGLCGDEETQFMRGKPKTGNEFLRRPDVGR